MNQSKNAPLATAQGIPSLNQRFAFANKDTVVQALIQSAWRAGATSVSLCYDHAALHLRVTHNGQSISHVDMLTKAARGSWHDETRKCQEPYGMRFLAAISAAPQVAIASGRQILTMATDMLPAGEAVAVQSLPDVAAGTTVDLYGFRWCDADMSAREIAAGFPLPVFFNGEELPRRDAVDNKAVAGTQGHYLLRGRVFTGAPVRAYLHGVCVFRRPSPVPASFEDVVHLNPLEFFGRLPDGDRVMDEERMLAMVTAELRRLYESRLLGMKRSLMPLDFCRQAYDLANSLQRLDVFNDAAEVPADWFGMVDALPSSVRYGATMVTPLRMVSSTEMRLLEGVTRAEVEQGRHILANLDPYQPWSGGQFNQLACMLAYASKALCVTQRLDLGHWIYQALSIDDDSLVEMEAEGFGATATVDHRAHFIEGVEVRLCDSVTLRCGAISASVQDVFFTDLDENVVALVPWAGDRYAAAYASTVQQFTRYDEDGVALEREAEEDAAEINAVVSALTAKSPEERVSHALREALRYCQDLRGMSFNVVIDASGGITVSTVGEVPTPQTAS